MKDAEEFNQEQVKRMVAYWLELPDKYVNIEVWNGTKYIEYKKDHPLLKVTEEEYEYVETRQIISVRIPRVKPEVL